MTESPLDAIVVGAGAAGLTAAGEGARRGPRVACLEALMFGGLVLKINALRPGAEFQR